MWCGIFWEKKKSLVWFGLAGLVRSGQAWLIIERWFFFSVSFSDGGDALIWSRVDWKEMRLREREIDECRDEVEACVKSVKHVCKKKGKVEMTLFWNLDKVVFVWTFFSLFRSVRQRRDLPCYNLSFLRWNYWNHNHNHVPDIEMRDESSASLKRYPGTTTICPTPR